VGAHRLNINHMHAGRNLVDQNQGANTTKQLLLLGFEQHKIISANGCQLQEVSVFVEVVGILLVVRNQLLVVFRAANEMVLNELDEAI